MKLLDVTSLASTVDAVNDAYFSGTPPSADERSAAAKFIASAQGCPGSYRGMFSPSPADRSGIRTYTGERVQSSAGIAHVLSEECLRVLCLLKIDNPCVREALAE